MINIVQILKQPFPLTQSWKSKMRMALFFGAFIFIFLLVFKPFQLDLLLWERFIWVALAYGFITFACVFLSSWLMPKFAPVFFSEEKWTTGREIFMVCIVLVLVGLVNYLVSPLLVNTKLSVRDAIWFQGVTLSVGLLPVVLFILLRQNMLLVSFREKAKLLEEKLKEKNQLQRVEKEKKTEPGTITIEGDYQNERLVIPAQQLYMVQSANNYIKVYFEQKEKVAYSIIRLTMKKAEDILSANGAFFRCHRTCIINLDKVTHVEGNAQGYRVTIEGIEEMIPISRNFSGEFSDRLLAIRERE